MSASGIKKKRRLSRTEQHEELQWVKELRLYHQDGRAPLHPPKGYWTPQLNYFETMAGYHDYQQATSSHYVSDDTNAQKLSRWFAARREGPIAYESWRRANKRYEVMSDKWGKTGTWHDDKGKS